MGMNSVLIVLNDHLDSIARDPEFGAKVADAVMNYGRDRFLSHAGARGFGVVSVAHADYDQLVRVDGNRGELLDAEEEEAVRKIRAKRERAAKKAATRPEQQRDQAMGVEALLKLLDDSGMVMGLRAQGHVPTVMQMLCDGATWKDIGAAIGWDGDAAHDWFDRFEVHDALATANETINRQADEIAQLKAELAHHVTCGVCAQGCADCEDCRATSLLPNSP